MKFVVRLVLGCFAVFCAGWLLRLDHARKISTNVLDLIPAEEQSPEIGLIRGFASNVQARVMLFALRDPRAPNTPPRAAAQAFANALTQSPAFAEVVVLGDSVADNALGRQVFDHRFEWLLPSWLGQREREFARAGEPNVKFSAWLAARAAGELETFLSRPEAAAIQDLLPRDPLLLVPRLVESARLLGAPGASASGHALVWARIKDSPFAEEGQGPVFAAVEQALARVRAMDAGVELRWTGVNRFAAASRTKIESEIGLLNTFSIVAVLGVSSLFVRRIYKLLHLVPVILLSIAAAWTVSTMVFDRLHILVFVIGSLLSGVAIDYGFYIYMQPSLRPDESYAAKLRRLLKPLLASCLTTVIGFSLLLFSELPLIRQIGVFVSAGLLCALIAAMLYFAQLERPLLEGRQFRGLDVLQQSPRARTIVRAMFGLGVTVALIGPFRLQWRDDVRQLDLPAPELHANEQALRALFGESPNRTIYLTYGETLASARQNLEEFLIYQRSAAPNVSAASVGAMLPTEADWRAFPDRLHGLGSFAADFRTALEQHGFTGESFAPFFSAWNALVAKPPASDYAALARGLAEGLKGPLALLSNLQNPPFWFLTVVEEPAGKPPPARLHTVGLDQLQSLNDLFTRYRWSALRLSLIGLSLVIVSVFAIYPPRRGLRIALIPAGSCFFVFGLLGLTGQTLNLFNLLGAFLGVCLSHNYAIFSSDNAAAGAAPPVPVRLSACCTAASFGVLGCSRIPVIHALGLTVALIVVTALAVVELEDHRAKADVMSGRLLAIWQDTVRGAPEAPALIDAATGRIWTRADLDVTAREWSAACGSGLAGQTVVFAETNGIAWLKIFFGLLHANAVAVALDPGEPLVAQRATALAIRAAWLWTNNQLEPVARRRGVAIDERRFVKLTSGSTGTPRALPFTDAQLIADGRQVCASMSITPTDVNLGLIPFGHSYGLGNLVLPLVLQGTAVVCGVAALPHAIAETIGQWRPTVFAAVPAILRALASADVPPEQLAGMRTVISAGAPLAAEVAQAFHGKFGKKIHSFYGSSETGGITFDRTGDAALTGRSVGTPMEGVRLIFERGGRFWVESAAVFTLGNRHRSAGGCGRHRPADIAELNSGGEIVLIGRAGRFVKIAGRRLNLAEVEQALKRLPGVRDAFVVSHAERADALAAAVATERTGEELRRALREQLASWKVPKKIVTFAAFPLTARGKTDTRELRAWLAERAP